METVEKQNMGAFIKQLAFRRGQLGHTFCTADDLHCCPDYDAEWTRGRLLALVQEAIQGVRSNTQHERNLGLYSLLEAQRILDKSNKG